VALAESPEQLERAARKQGMVPAANPVFLRLSDGAILGVPVAAKAERPAPSAAAAPKAAARKPAARTAAAPTATPAPAAPKASATPVPAGGRR
jgi:hypothetical protein